MAERLGEKLPGGFFPGPPDLAVEVPAGDRAGEVIAKVRDWLDAGAQTVWVVDPDSQTVTVYLGSREAKILGPSDTLAGGDLLPGFRTPVAEFFSI